MKELYEQINQHKKMNEEAKVLEEKRLNLGSNIKDYLKKNFIDIGYEVERLELKKSLEYIVYYPVLKIPEGFKKRNNEYLTYCGDWGSVDNRSYIINRYELVDENGNCIEFECEGTLYEMLYRGRNMKIYFNKQNGCCRATALIYKIKIFGEEYKLYENFKFEERLIETFQNNKLVDGEFAYRREDAIKHDRQCFSDAQKMYEEFMNKFESPEFSSIEDLEKYWDDIELPSGKLLRRSSEGHHLETSIYENEEISVDLRTLHYLVLEMRKDKNEDREGVLHYKEIMYHKYNELKEEMTLGELMELFGD